MSEYVILFRKLFYFLKLHWLRMRARQPYIWEGIYEHYKDVPAQGPGFNGQEWISSATESAVRGLAALSNSSPIIPYDVPPFHRVLALTLALLAQSHSKLSVLDFGGGMGHGYISLLRSCGVPPQLDYWVVDNELSCKTGTRLLGHFSDIRFASTLPQDLKEVDLILLSGVLQFIEDYNGLLRGLTAYQPSYWLFTFLPAGDIPTFASAQKNVLGSTIPVWFFNLSALIETMREFGYEIVFKSAMDRQFDMGNFPHSHQLSQQCHLLFHRRRE